MDFQIDIKKSKRTTIPKLKIISSDTVRVIAPYYFTKHACKLLINTNLEWIEKNLKIVKEKEDSTKEVLEENRDKILLFGEWVKYTIEPTIKRKFLFEKELILRSKESIKEFYRSQGEEFFTTNADYYSRIIGQEYGKISLRWQKTLWGSCSGNGNLSFNLKLIKAPFFVGEYVVAHEISHLIHKNHSRNFYNQVDSIFDRRVEAEQWLKINGKILHHEIY